MRNWSRAEKTLCSCAVLVVLTFASSVSAQELAEETGSSAAGASADVVLRMITFADTFGFPEYLQSTLVDIAKQGEAMEPASEKAGEGDEMVALLESATDGTTQSELESEALAALDERRTPGSGDRESQSANAASGSGGTDENREAGEDGASRFERVASAGRDGDEADHERGVDLDGGLAGDSKRRARTDASADLGLRHEQQSIEEVLDLFRDDLVRCYRERRTERPGLAGTVTLRFVIDADGEVVSAEVAESSLGDDATESCMIDKIRTIDFPAPKSGQKTTWNLPFHFQG